VKVTPVTMAFLFGELEIAGYLVSKGEPSKFFLPTYLSIEQYLGGLISGTKDAPSALHLLALLGPIIHDSKCLLKLAEHLLVKYKADPNQATKDGETPLHVAIDSLPLVKTLLAHGADANAGYQMTSPHCTRRPYMVEQLWLVSFSPTRLTSRPKTRMGAHHCSGQPSTAINKPLNGCLSLVHTRR